MTGSSFFGAAMCDEEVDSAKLVSQASILVKIEAPKCRKNRFVAIERTIIGFLAF